MMTPAQFKLAKDMVWHEEFGPNITTNLDLSNLLAQDLKDAGIDVIRVGRKPKSRNKFIVFTIRAQRVKGMDLKFLSQEDADAWQKAKSRGLSTLMKAPDEAFLPVQLEEVEEMIWWNQAMSLAYRLGSTEHSEKGILTKQGAFVGKKYGI